MNPSDQTPPAEETPSTPDAATLPENSPPGDEESPSDRADRILDELRIKFPNSQFRIMCKRDRGAGNTLRHRLQRLMGNRWAAICDHGQQPSRCGLCGGDKRCIHGRRPNTCVDCGGSSVCEHRRLRNQCRDCNGSALCNHDGRVRQRSKCRICRGGHICEHGVRRSVCRTCGGSEFCNHGHLRYRCRECHGASICEHNRRREHCADCRGRCICEHRNQRHQCRLCDPTYIPTGSGVSKIGCEVMDALEIELGTTIQHSHYETLTQTLTRNEFRPDENRRLCVDGYIADGKKVIEFLGDEFHGHPSLFPNVENHFGQRYDDLYETTMVRLQWLVQRGYEVYYIWECEYLAYKRVPAESRGTLWNQFTRVDSHCPPMPVDSLLLPPVPSWADDDASLQLCTDPIPTPLIANDDDSGGGDDDEDVVLSVSSESEVAPVESVEAKHVPKKAKFVHRTSAPSKQPSVVAVAAATTRNNTETKPTTTLYRCGGTACDYESTRKIAVENHMKKCKAVGSAPAQVIAREVAETVPVGSTRRDHLGVQKQQETLDDLRKRIPDAEFSIGGRNMAIQRLVSNNFRDVCIHGRFNACKDCRAAEAKTTATTGLVTDATTAQVPRGDKGGDGGGGFFDPYPSATLPVTSAPRASEYTLESLQRRFPDMSFEIYKNETYDEEGNRKNITQLRGLFSGQMRQTCIHARPVDDCSACCPLFSDDSFQQ